MKGVLLVNIGGAESKQDLKLFLRRMFNDPFIIPYGKRWRNLLSYIITNSRYKSSWRKYVSIGGSKTIFYTETYKNVLQLNLGDDYLVKTAYSYSEPLIRDTISFFVEEGINDITVIPMYPQASISTTDSVQKDVNDAIAGNKDVKLTFIREFYHHPGFINFWTEMIEEHIKLYRYNNPYLLFSAHSIPKYLVDKGDTYPNAIQSCSKAIAEAVGLPYEVAYQSKMKGSKWIGPDIKESLKKLSDNKINEIIIIPISFVNENLETTYDIGWGIMRYNQKYLDIEKISRVGIPIAHEDFVIILRDLVLSNKVN